MDLQAHSFGPRFILKRRKGFTLGPEVLSAEDRRSILIENDPMRALAWYNLVHVQRGHETIPWWRLGHDVAVRSASSIRRRGSSRWAVRSVPGDAPCPVS